MAAQTDKARGAPRRRRRLARRRRCACRAPSPTTRSRPTAFRRLAISLCPPTSSISPMSIPTRRRAACCRCRSPRPAATRISTRSTRSTSFRSKGDGAAGMGAPFRHADGRQRRRAGFGLWAARPRRALHAPTSSNYRFLLRPEARFSDGSKLTAADVAFSLDILKDQGAPDLCRSLLERGRRARAPKPTTSSSSASSRRAAATRI